MAGEGPTGLFWVLLVAAGGLRLCWGSERLEGVKGQALSFPALRLDSADVARVTWRTRGTHIAEVKPREKKFTIDYLPHFHGRLFLRPTELSLEIRPLKLEDAGTYEVVVDSLSDPTNPKTFSYNVLVDDVSPVTRSDDTQGHGRVTTGPPVVTEPDAEDATTMGAGGGQPPSGDGGSEGCRAWDRYCVLKGYLVATILGLLLVLVATTHVVTRDKATEV